MGGGRERGLKGFTHTKQDNAFLNKKVYRLDFLTEHKKSAMPSGGGPLRWGQLSRNSAIMWSFPLWMRQTTQTIDLKLRKMN